MPMQTLLRVFCLSLTLTGFSGLALAADDAVAKACAVLKGKKLDRDLTAVAAALCGAVKDDCGRRSDHAACAADPRCQALRGSGSGPNCSPCTPDMVFWSCGPASREALAEQVINWDACSRTQGVWSTRDAWVFSECRCDRSARAVRGRGCVPVEKVCAEAGGVWLPLDQARGRDTTEYTTVAECEREDFARWEPSPAPPLGRCTDSVTKTTSVCDQAQRQSLQGAGQLTSYRELTTQLVLCTFKPKDPKAPTRRYPFSTPANTVRLQQPFCRVKGGSQPI